MRHVESVTLANCTSLSLSLVINSSTRPGTLETAESTAVVTHGAQKQEKYPERRQRKHWKLKKHSLRTL